MTSFSLANLRCERYLVGFAKIIDSGGTPNLITFSISPFVAQSNPAPNRAKVWITIGSWLHLTAVMKMKYYQTYFCCYLLTTHHRMVELWAYSESNFDACELYQTNRKYKMVHLLHHLTRTFVVLYRLHWSVGLQREYFLNLFPFRLKPFSKSIEITVNKFKFFINFLIPVICERNTSFLWIFSSTVISRQTKN